MNKHDVIDTLEQMALLLELAGENPFKVRAFQNAARALEGFEPPLAAAVADGSLRAVKGIGPGLFADIRALVEQGSLPAYEALKASTPAGLLEMMDIPGLGAKKVRAIHEGLQITSVGELEYAAQENRLVDLPGFGAKTQAKILESIAHWKQHRDMHLLSDVLGPVEAVAEALRAHPAALQVEVAGDVRRRLETLRRVGIVAASPDPDALSAAFEALPGVEAVLSGGLVRLKGGIETQLTVTGADEFPAALLHHTGSDDFVVAMQGRAKARGLTLDASGLRRDGVPVSVDSERALFAALDLPLIPPEAREAPYWEEWAVPAGPGALVVQADLQGIFHVHTTYSDGEATVRDMALAARSLGFRYVGVSDHSEAAFYARGLTRERLAAQRAEIAALNDELDGITILAGIEADILADGSLDYDDETLASFDFVIGSVHSRFGQDAEAMTQRLVKALSHPRLTMLGHMTGRLLLSRAPYAFDLDAVLATAERHGKIIELNANPHRLDMDWRDLRRARDAGIPIAINPDAHSPGGLDHVRYGVAMARKGGLSAQHVINTQPIEKVLERLRR